MKARTMVLAAALLAGAALAAGAFDWGGTLDNRSTLTDQDSAGFLQEDKLALWLESPLGKGLTLTAQGSYTFSLQTRGSGDPLIEHVLDVDLLRVEAEYPLARERPALVAFTAGRFPLADFSRWVLDTTVDGAQVRFANPRLKASLAVAFTGLELEPVSTVSMSWADENSDGPLAAPRLLELAQLELPELFRRQDLRLALLAQEDLRSQADLIQEGETTFVPGEGGRVHSAYLGAGLGGPLSSGLYYDAFAWLATGRMLSYMGAVYEYAWMLGGLFGGSLRYYREDWLSTRARLGLLVATGDADYTDWYFEGNTEGLATAFLSMTSSDLGVVFSPRVGNLAALEASWSIKPLAVLQTELSAWLFLRPSVGQISDARVDPGSDSRYLGSEIDVRAALRPFSDLGGALSLGLFLPGGAFADAYSDPEFRGRLEISFGF